MALVEIDVVGALADDQRAAVLSRAHQAVVDTLRVPKDDPTVLVRDLPATHAIVPGVRERFALVRVTMFAGRRRATVVDLINHLKQNIGSVLGVPDDVTVVVVEVPRERWSAEGGQTAADVDLGFEVEV